MKACMKPYGALPSMCRRLSGHEYRDADGCGSGNEVEHALVRAFEATAELRRLARAGERDFPPEFWTQVFRDLAAPGVGKDGGK